MFLLLGASGFLAGAFAAELRRRGSPFKALSRRERDYTQFNVLFDYVRRERPEFIINAAGLPGTPNVDACEHSREEVMHANMILPQQIAQISRLTNTPWAHVSSGCIFAGARVRNGAPETERIERDLPGSELARKHNEQPGSLVGFSEIDEPNFSFLNPPCNFYSGTKALGEEAIGSLDLCYILRPGLPPFETGSSAQLALKAPALSQDLQSSDLNALTLTISLGPVWTSGPAKLPSAFTMWLTPGSFQLWKSLRECVWDSG